MSKIMLPKLIFGTSGLGNLYVATPFGDKLKVVSECIKHSETPVVFDTAGKYGAGLALETLGKCLNQLNVSPNDVIISNKLGWYRTELTGSEPTFEPGVWCELSHDAIQKISYKGILECYEQGNQLLNGYSAQMVSVHDPDQYLAVASDQVDHDERYADILAAYRALTELKRKGRVRSIGIGAKNWKIIARVAQDVALDWVMIANSMTVYSCPEELKDFMQRLAEKGVEVINSAVFNGGFLTGADHYNYQPVSRATHPAMYQWRDDFYALCAKYNLEPAAVCVNFGLNAPGVSSIAMNTTNAARVVYNMGLTSIAVPEDFWQEMVSQGLMDSNKAITR